MQAIDTAIRPHPNDTIERQPIFTVNFEFVKANKAVQLPPHVIMTTLASVKFTGNGHTTRPVGDRRIEHAFASRTAGCVSCISYERAKRLAKEMARDYGLNPCFAGYFQSVIFEEFERQRPTVVELCERHELPESRTRFDLLVRYYETTEIANGAIQWVEHILRTEATTEQDLYSVERSGSGWIFKSSIHIPEWPTEPFDSWQKATQRLTSLHQRGHLRTEDYLRMLRTINSPS